MHHEALLELYLEKLRQYTLENLSQNNLSIIEALKESLSYLEGEMSGY